MATRILCIDDDSNICELLSLYLQKEAMRFVLHRTVWRVSASSVPTSRIWCSWTL